MTSEVKAAAFSGPVYHGDSIQWEDDGFTFHASIEHDSDAGPPWDREDGHGPVTAWLTDDPGPDFRELWREGRAARFYCWSEALAVAIRDGWSAPPHDSGTAQQRAERAVYQDFLRLRAWCADEWFYVGVIVNVSKAGVTLTQTYDHALWGIENDSPDYLTETAREIAREALAAAREKLAELCSSPAA